MDVTVYFDDGSEERIKHVTDITWSESRVYIDVKQTWNETEAKDEPFIFWKEKVSQILINFN